MTALAIKDVMTAAPVMPVVTIEEAARAAPLARALLAGGLPAVEVTLRTVAALDAIAAIARDVPDAIVGAGTVRNADDLRRAADAGARFAVSPGLTPALAAAAADSPIPLLPGAATATEMMIAADAGYRHLKFFPAVVAGGPGALKSFAGPFPDLRFCPTGGVKLANANEYLNIPNVLCVGGTWIAPAESIAAGNWRDIEQAARAAAALR